MDSIKNARCQVCDDTFELDAQQQKFVAPLIAKGQKFIMIECPSCGSSTQYINVVETVKSSDQTASYRCPITQCTGWVDLIDEEARPFWGCGECGSVWFEEKNLQKEITSIVALHPYRAFSYKKLNGKWTPGVLSSEAESYDKLVEQEPVDDHDALVRG
jgi:predicted nucleic-acid-binding Zn-ribbon protein